MFANPLPWILFIWLAAKVFYKYQKKIIIFFYAGIVLTGPQLYQQ